jgi:hypothetical protein
VRTVNRTLFIFCCIVFPGAASLFAQTWNFAKERDGIKVYTRKEPDSELKSFKSTLDVHSTMDKVLYLIGNVKNTEWWEENVKNIKIMAYEKDKYARYYLVYDVPWPFSDRDLCVEAKITDDPATGKRVIFATPMTNVCPMQPELVRITKYWQRWTVQPMGNGVIRLTLEGFVDPGGNVPSWLYNMVITDAPLKVMRGVRNRVEAPSDSTK